jgi:hypothetical protein
MKKFTYLLVSIILIIVVIVWIFYWTNYLSFFYQIDVWGVYLFAVPIVYCFFRVTSNQPSLKVIIYIFLGVLISILLNRTFDFMLQKILMTVAGVVIIWALEKLTKSNSFS